MILRKHFCSRLYSSIFLGFPFGLPGFMWFGVGRKSGDVIGYVYIWMSKDNYTVILCSLGCFLSKVVEERGEE